jgi:putative pyruvate formate lyase activating enzyme
MGKTVSPEEFARICLALQEQGAENINIVTGSHGIPAIAQGLVWARSLGLQIPILWNSSGYESLEALALLEDLIDVYLPDLKTLDKTIGKRFFNAPDYPAHAQAVILRMLETRRLSFKSVRGKPLLVSGVVVRHLALPDCLESTKKALQWFAEHCQDKALFSLMTQYTPVGPSSLTRSIDEGEYEHMTRWLEEFDSIDGFYQELVPDTSWLPDFTRINPFSSELSKPVWHWKTNFV